MLVYTFNLRTGGVRLKVMALLEGSGAGLPPTQLLTPAPGPDLALGRPSPG